jgi:hypothetical protein
VPALRKISVLFIAIGLLCIQCAAGFSVPSVIVSPPGNLEDETFVTVICEIPRTGILLYDQLVITTDLDSPAWDPVVVVRDNGTPVTPASAADKSITINGAVYNYPQPVKLRITVTGTVPANHTANQTLLGIRQIDSEGTEYAWPSGNYILPMPGSPSAVVPGTGATTVPVPEETFFPYTVPATLTPAPEKMAPPTIGTSPETILAHPTPLPATPPKKAAPAAGPLAAAGLAGIVLFFARRFSGS